jgi:hypothetical protein
VIVKVTVAADGEVVGFEVHAGDEAREPGTTARAITARSLRAIPFGELADATRALPTIHHKRVDDGRLEVIARWEQIPVPRPSKQGRKRRPDLYLAELALAYRLWQGTGEPLKALAKRAHLSVAGLRDALKDARDRGFLTEAPRGRKGGEPTEKAYRVLEHDSAYLSVVGNLGWTQQAKKGDAEQ